MQGDMMAMQEVLKIVYVLSIKGKNPVSLDKMYRNGFSKSELFAGLQQGAVRGYVLPSETAKILTKREVSLSAAGIQFVEGL